MPKIFFFIILAAVSISASGKGKSASSLIDPFKDLEGVEYVDILSTQGYLDSLKNMSDELRNIHKSITQFEIININDIDEDKLDILSTDLVAKAGLIEFYSEIFKPETGKGPIADIISQMTHIFDYVKCFAKRKGDYYDEFVYIVRANNGQSVIAYVKGKLRDDQISLALPKVSTEVTITDVTDDE